MDITINNISAEQIGLNLEFEGRIVKVKECSPLIINGLYKCSNCMATYEITNNKFDNKVIPDICSDCGSNKIKFVPNKSKYIDSQEIIIEDMNNFIDKYNRKRTPKQIKCLVYGKDVNQHIEDDIVDVKGLLSVTLSNEMFLEVTDINLLDK